MVCCPTSLAIPYRFRTIAITISHDNQLAAPRSICPAWKSPTSLDALDQAEDSLLLPPVTLEAVGSLAGTASYVGSLANCSVSSADNIEPASFPT